MYYPVLSSELEAMFTKCQVQILQSYFISYGYDKNINISLKFIMLTDNNQIFRNCFVIIIYCHLTKVSSQINKCIIFEPNEISITLSTLWSHPVTDPLGENSRNIAKRQEKSVLKLYQIR